MRSEDSLHNDCRRDGYDESSDAHNRYCFLKNESNLTDRQCAAAASSYYEYDLKTVRCVFAERELSGRFWQYSSPYWAERFLQLWCARAMRSKQWNR